MIMLSQLSQIGKPDELIFVNPHHVVSVRSMAEGEGSHITLIHGGFIQVVEDRNDVVEDIEKEIGQ